MDRARHDDLGSLSDPELVRLLIAGNHDAMTVIFDRHWRPVMSVAVHILHDTAEAEDVVQMVFIEFYQKAKLFDESKGKLRTWLLQYSYGRSFNQRRKLKARGFFEQIEVAEAEKVVYAGGPERVSEVEIHDAAILVEQILPHLSQKQREVIQMAFFQGMKLSEVADESGEPVANIRHAYYRGIDKLRSLLSRSSKRSSTELSSEKSSEEQMSWLRKRRSNSLTGEADVA